jgi:hypothetical protein
MEKSKLNELAERGLFWILKNEDIEQLLQPDSAMSRFLLVVASLLGNNRAITPRRLSKC